MLRLADHKGLPMGVTPERSWARGLQTKVEQRPNAESWQEVAEGQYHGSVGATLGEEGRAK